MKYYLVAGEASGDLHASNLMQGIMEFDSNAEFRYFGGDLMADKGGTLVKHYRDLAFMGFWEVVYNFKTIAENLSLCKKDIATYKPDVLILVDYPGFNLRIAKFAKKQGIRVFYYIAPKVWAWRESRVELIKEHVDKLFVIFPFEVDFFKKHGIEAIYEGNPLVDSISLSGEKEAFSNFASRNGLDSRPIIALLAGSRRQELRYNLPRMLSLVKAMPYYQFVIAGAPSLSIDDYKPYIGNVEVALVFGQTYQILKQATLAVVTSGTATLEAALLGIPEVVCYRGNTISMLIAWLVIKVKYISLVNLIMDKVVVKELKQYDFSEKRLHDEVRALLPGSKDRDEMSLHFKILREKVGSPYVSKRIAQRIIELINCKT